MLLDYIENSIVRKVNLIYLLFYSDKQSIESLALKLNCAALTLLDDVVYLQNELGFQLEIVDEDNNNMLVLHNTGESFHELLLKIYATSYFLKFFAYFFEKNNGRYADYTNSHHLSTATGYRLRKDIRNFIESLGLKLKDNTITGRGVIVRFLATELQRNFGVQLFDLTPQVTTRANNILDEMGKILNVQFSQQERHLFSLLLQISVDGNYIDEGYGFSSAQINSISSKIYPKELVALLKENFDDLWLNPTQELNFSILSFIVVNSHVFDQSVPKSILKTNHAAFQNHPDVHKLIKAIDKTFIINQQLIDYFYTSLYLFIRDSSFDVQPITLGNYIQIAEPNTTIYRLLTEILNDWNTYGISLNKYHIMTLYNRIAPILSLSLYQNIVIVSDKQVDANFVSDYISLLINNKSTNISITNAIKDDHPLLQDQQSIFIIDKNADITLPKNDFDNYIFTSFPISNSEIFYLLNSLSLI